MYRTPDKYKLLSWMVYYDNNCQIYEFNKDNMGQYLRKPRKTLNIMSKRIIIKLKKETFKPLTNKEFEEKIKKIKGLHKEAKKIVN